MDQIRITGGQKLQGTITISGAKNAALPLMAASLLSAEPLTLTNIPGLADIATMVELLENHGVHIETTSDADLGQKLTLTAQGNLDKTAPYDIVRKMRASVLVLGPLLARLGEAVVSLPGGCAIGTRPIDLHLSALEQMGAQIELKDGYVHAIAPDGLHGATIRFPFVSVGATENVLMAASLAKGCEQFDRPIYQALGGVVAWHALKHLLGAAATACVLVMLYRRGKAGVPVGIDAAQRQH